MPNATATPSQTPTPLRSPTPEPTETSTPTTEPGLPVVSVPASIAANTTWSAGNVYVITGQAALNAGVTLTIQPGAIVKFQNNGATKGRLTVNGVLLAQGTAGATVVFTSIHDDTAGGDTNHNGGGTWSNPGDWDGLVFGTTAGGSSLSYAIVRYGGAGSAANVKVTGAAVTLSHVALTSSAWDGVQWLNGASGQIAASEIAGSLNNAIVLSAASSPAISGNTLRDNRAYALYLEGNCFPAFTGNALYGNGTNAAGVYGTVGTGAWYPNVTYVATANLTVESSSTLTLQPGVVVKFQSNTSLIVRGALAATGTDLSRIVFTSLKDDAFGGDTQEDGSATKPAAGDWGALYFADTSVDAMTVLDFVTVRYAGASYNYGAGVATAGIAPDSASPTLDHLVVEWSSGYGLQLLNASSPSLRRSTIQDNANHGLWLSASSGPAVSGNRFLRNGGYAVYLGGTSQAMFQANVADGNFVNGVGLAGSISSNTTWEPDLPYVIADNTTLEINTALTLQPGVVVKFAAGKKWTVNGSLLAEGTAAQPIVFTSLKDDTVGGDTNGNANASYPASGDWEALSFTQTSAGSRLAHVHFRYGGSNSATGAVVFDGGAPNAAQDLTVMAAKYRGVYVNNASPYLAGLRLTANQVGVYNSATAYAIVQYSAIYANTQYGVQNANTAYTLMATENWWGSATGPTHASNPGGIGDVVSNYMDFSGFAAVSPMPLPDPLPGPGTPPTWTTISSNIAANTTWTTASSPYIVTADVAVNAGIKLTIQPGVIVKFAAARKLTVNGILSAIGTAGSPILFTSIKDDLAGDANGDGAATYPKPGDWGGITFADSSVDALTRLQFAVVRYAGSGGFGVLTDAASPTLSDGQISDNSGYGLLARNYAAPPVSRNWILDNRGGGIKLETTASPSLTDNQLWGNGGYAVYMDATCYPTLSGNVAYYNWRNAVRDGGTISFNQTWYANLDYVVEGTLTINVGAALTVQPGTVVKFSDTGSGIAVNGALVADGTAAQKIAFTSVRDQALGHDVLNLQMADGKAQVAASYFADAAAPEDRAGLAALEPEDYWPVAGDWGRIAYADSSDDTKNVLNYAIVRYAGYSVNNALYANSAAPRITNSQITNNTGHGLYLESQANPTVEGNSFTRNGLSGIYVRTASAPIIRSNTFRNNGAYAVEMEADAKPRFSGNVAADNATNGVKVTGTVAGATTWDANLVYVAGAVTIPSGASLTPAAGTIIKFLAAASWTVNGPLVVDGTEAAPIVLTSLKDDTYGGDTNNDGGTSAPAAGDWGSLTVSSTASASRFSYAFVRYGGDPAIKVSISALSVTNTTLDFNKRALWFDQSTGTVTNDRFLSNADYGLYETASGLTVQNNTFQQNRWGAYVITATAGHAVINGNTFTDNSGYAIYFDFASYPYLGSANSFLYPGMIGNAIRVQGGTIAQNTTLISNAVYWLDSWTVATGMALTVQVNTIIKLNPGALLTIAGTLNGTGTSGNPVVFTSYKDDSVGGDTNGDGAASSPAKSDWDAIHITNGTVNLDYATVRYAGGSGYYGAITQSYNNGLSTGYSNANISINHSTLSDNGKPAVYLGYKTGVSGTLSLLYSTVQNNTSNGIQVNAGFPATIGNSMFSGNTNYAAYLGLSSGNSLILSGNQGSGNLHDAIYIYGTSDDITLAPQGSLVYQFGDIAVPTGKTMTLQPGAIVKSNASALTVAGTLNATGTSGNPVVFTSYKDDSVGGDTNGDGTASSPAKSDWDAIYTTNGTVNLDYATVRYAGGSGYYGAITQSYNNGLSTGYSNANISINHSTLSDNGKPAVYLGYKTGVSGTLSLLYSTVQNNTSNGIQVNAGFPATIGNSMFSGNTNYAAYLGLSSGNSLILSGNQGSGNLHDAIYIYGTSDDITLAPQGSLVYQFGDIAVPTGKTMTLQPGAIVKSNASALTVAGTLNATGTSGNPVVFTSYKDDSVGGDTNGDGTASSPAKSDWDAIYTTNGTVNLDYATVRYAGGSGYYGAITQSYNNGLSTGYSNANISINHSTLSDNGKPAVYLGYKTGILASAVVNNSNIFGNTSYGIYSGFSPAVVNAENNWWGSDSGPAPYGTGNGINYRTYTCGTPPATCYDYGAYVDAVPWVGQKYWVASQLGRGGPSTRNQAIVGDPVNTANGNYAYQRTDLSIPTRGLSLEWARAYNSLDPQAGPLGYGWTHTWNLRLVKDTASNTVVVTFGDSHAEKWTWNGSTYDGAPGIHGVLVKNVDGTFVLIQKDQARYHFLADGRLAWAEDKNANRTTLTYDGQNRLVTIAEPAGRTLTLAYTSPFGTTLISRVTDHTARAAQYTYDANANLITVTDVTGQVTTLTYDANHRLLTMTDANGHTFVRNVYDANNRVSEQYDALNNKWTFAYDEPAHKTLVTDPRNFVTTYQYDGDWRLTSEKDALNYTTSFVYDADNNRTQVTDKRGNVTKYAYDGRGNATTITDALNAVSSFAYDTTAGRNNLLSETNPRGFTTTYEYDARSNLVKRADALSHITTWSYDGQGQLVSTTDAASHTMTYGYDAYSYWTSVTDPLSHTTSFTYDSAGRKLSETDPLGRNTYYIYDTANRLLTVSEPLGKTTAYTYDAVGNRITVTENGIRNTQYVYDAKDRLATVTDPLGHVTTYAYDTVDNQVSVTDPLGHATTFTYDAVNQRTSVKDALNHSTSYQYDGNGNRTKLNDANNKITQYAYDAMNRLAQVTDAANGVVMYAYDAAGNRTSMTDANNHTTTYAYDALNRLVSTTDPLSHVTGYGYDAVGNRSSQAKPDGTTVTYANDALNRLVGTSYPGGSISYVYDAAGNRVTLTDASGTTTYTYDDLNRLTQAAAPGGTVGYGYDLFGNRTSLTYPGAQTVTYAYDLASRLTAVTDHASRITQYTYDAANRPTGIQYPNDVQAAYTYDTADQLLSLIHTHPVNGTIASATYTLDAVGNRLSMQDLDGTTSYLYDSLYRLTQVSYPGGEQVTYAYDPMGNRTSLISTVSGATSYTYDAADRLLTAGATSFTWDANGRMTGKGSATYAYDPLDRLTQVVDGATTVQFAYNGDGVRLSKTVNGATTAYVQDVQAPLPVVLAETTGGQTSRYIYGNDLLERADPAGVPAFYHADGLGSTRALSDLAGQRTDAYSYDVFGATRSHTGSSGQPFTFTGEQGDAELGLVYLRARYYDSQVGRFIQRDSRQGLASRPESLNRYVYVQNNPASLVDPSGEAWWDAPVAWVRNNVPTMVKYGIKGVNWLTNQDLPTFPISLWGAVETGKKTAEKLASLEPTQEDIRRRVDRDCPGCLGADDIARIAIMHEEMFQRSVMTLDEAIKTVPLVGSGYGAISYLLGYDAFIKQQWRDLTQKTRARSGEPPTDDSQEEYRGYYYSYPMTSSGGANYGSGGPPSKGK